MSPARVEPSSFGSWLQRNSALLGLLRDTNYRRNILTIHLLNLRRMIGWRFVLAFFFFPVLCGWLVTRFAATEVQAIDLLLAVFGTVALGLGATLYSSEQQSGTFELLWLATGSERSLLRFKIIANIIALAVIALPALVLCNVFPFLPGFPGLMAFFLIVTNALFIFAAMAMMGTWFRQPWAAALLGLVFFAAWFWGFHGSQSMFYLFFNPAGSAPLPSVISGPGMRSPQSHAGVVPLSAIIANRVLILGVSSILLRIAERRMRRIF